MARLRCYLPRIVAGIFLLVAVGCVPESEPPENTRQAIVGGQAAETCQWPTAVMVLPRGCSGTVVHPRAVITAKHCLETPQTAIGIGENWTKWATTVPITECFSHPTSDFGICLLAQDLTDLPIIPVMAPCEAAELRVGAKAVEVGFGTELAIGRSASGRKSWIEVELVTTGRTSTGQLLDRLDVTTGSQAGEYFGDSGGPLFYRMADGTFRLVGEDCCSPDIDPTNAKPRISTYISIPYHVPWAEQVSGLDLTPCHDQTTWTGGPNCQGYPVNPDRLGGTWTALCSGQMMWTSGTCGGPDAGVWIEPDSNPIDESPDTLPDAGVEIGSDTVPDVGADASPADAAFQPVDGPPDTPSISTVEPPCPLPSRWRPPPPSGCACGVVDSGPAGGKGLWLLLLAIPMFRRRCRK